MLTQQRSTILSAINQSWKATIVQGWIHVTQVELASHRSAGKLSFFAEHVRRRMQKIGERVRARWDGRSVAVIFQIATQSFTPDLLPRGRKRRPPSPLCPRLPPPPATHGSTPRFHWYKGWQPATNEKRSYLRVLQKGVEQS